MVYQVQSQAVEVDPVGSPVVVVVVVVVVPVRLGAVAPAEFPGAVAPEELRVQLVVWPVVRKVRHPNRRQTRTRCRCRYPLQT